MPNLRVNNINLYYEVNGNGQPLVFIHGLGWTTDKCGLIGQTLSVHHPSV